MDWITGNVDFSQQSSSTIVVRGEDDEMNAECAHVCTVPVNSITMMVLDPGKEYSLPLVSPRFIVGIPGVLSTPSAWLGNL